MSLFSSCCPPGGPLEPLQRHLRDWAAVEAGGLQASQRRDRLQVRNKVKEENTECLVFNAKMNGQARNILIFHTSLLNIHSGIKNLVLDASESGQSALSIAGEAVYHWTMAGSE